MVREHARSTAALDLAAAFWDEQQAEDAPALRGLVCLFYEIAPPDNVLPMPVKITFLPAWLHVSCVLDTHDDCITTTCWCTVSAVALSASHRPCSIAGAEGGLFQEGCSSAGHAAHLVPPGAASG